MQSKLCWPTVRGALPLVLGILVACGGSSSNPPAKTDAAGNVTPDAGTADLAPVDASATDLHPSDLPSGDLPSDEVPRTPSNITGWTLCGSLETPPARRTPWAITASQDGRFIAVLDTALGADQKLQSTTLWDAKTGKIVRRHNEPAVAWHSYSFDVDLSPNGELLAITGDGEGVFRTSDGAQLWQHPPPPDIPVTTMGRTFAFSPASDRLVVGAPQGEFVLEATTGTLLKTLSSTPSLAAFAFSPDGARLASSVPQLLRVSDWTSQWSAAPRSRDQFSGVNIADNWTAFSPNGRELLAQIGDVEVSGTLTPVFRLTARILDADTGRVVKTLPRTLGRRPSYSPDGQRIVAAATVLTLANEEEQTLTGAVDVSLFLPDGRIATALHDGRVELYCPK